LRPKSFDVLHYLVQHPQRLVSREELLRAAWPGVVVTDDSLTQCLIEIRKALDDREKSIVRTVPRRGYLFDVPVQVETAGRPVRCGAGRSPGRAAAVALDPGCLAGSRRGGRRHLVACRCAAVGKLRNAIGP
jgi:DNA-binding winged helix-turn-helix (wHTH) protein